ncbi:MAG: NusG domain II-containing protein [Thiobacillus sp.]
MLRAGDAVVLAAGAGTVIVLAWWSWLAPAGDTAVIRAGGKIVETVALTQARRLSVAGPLGTTQIEVEPGRARIAADPSPRQLCVKQGWLSQAGEAALCLPNQVSLEIRGRTASHDTRVY